MKSLGSIFGSDHSPVFNFLSNASIMAVLVHAPQRWFRAPPSSHPPHLWSFVVSQSDWAETGLSKWFKLAFPWLLRISRAFWKIFLACLENGLFGSLSHFSIGSFTFNSLILLVLYIWQISTSCLKYSWQSFSSPLLWVVGLYLGSFLCCRETF